MNLPSYGQYGPAGFEAVSRKLAQLCNDIDREYLPWDVSYRDKSVVNWFRSRCLKKLHHYFQYVVSVATGTSSSPSIAFASA
jgi:hypothetical protein